MNCLELALEKAKGRLTEQEILDAFESEQEIREAFIEKGLTDNLDERVSSKIATQAMEKKIEVARLKRQIAQNIKARATLDTRIADFRKGGLSPRKSLIALWEGSQRSIKGARASGYAQAQAYEAKWIGSLTSTVEKDKPHIMKMLANDDFDQAVTRELHELREGGSPGVTKNSDAVYLAKQLATHMELARVELNRLGAAIGKLDGYAGPQIHDDIAMLRVSAAKWIADIKPMLDLERTFPDVTDDLEIQRTLEKVYNTIITGMSDGPSPLQMGKRIGPANMATRLGQHRVLHFKGADESIKYRDMYGRGSTIQGILSMMRNQAHTAGAMDTFGPNPKAMLLSISEKLRAELKNQIDGMPAGKERDKLVKQMNELAATDGEVAYLKATIDDITGVSHRAVNQTAATIGNNIRTVQSMAKLGGAVLTAMPSDMTTMGAAAMFRGQGFWNGIFRSLNEMGGGTEGKQVGYLLGEGFDAVSGYLGSAVNDGPMGRMSKLTQTFYKWSGLSLWTDTARSISARVTAAHLGQNTATAFDKLDPRLAHVLTLNNIDAAKWDAIRAAKFKEVNGNLYVTPDKIRDLPDEAIRPLVDLKIKSIEAAAKRDKDGNLSPQEEGKLAKRIATIIADGRRDLELDLHRYYADEASYSIVETDAASRRLATRGYRPGTLAGEVTRYVMQFKGFPIAFGQRILGRAIMNAPTGRSGQVAHIGALMAGLTAAGYMAMTSKDMAKGIWPPRDPFSPKTWGAAALQGGALGIYGDFLFGAQTRYGQGPIEVMSGPTVGTAAELYSLWQDARQGDPKAAKYLNLAINNTPFINLFYTRTALDVLFLNSLRESASPGYLRRQETTLRKERGQGFAIPRTLGQALR